jgi:hypothetical protein
VIIAFQVSDEGTHPAGPQEHWNESFYVNCFDARQEIGLASRIAFSPNQGFADGFVLLYLPQGHTAFVRTWEPCADHRGRNAVGPIAHVCVEPFRQWRLRYQGPVYHFDDPLRMGDFMQTMLTDIPRKAVELELRFEAIHDVFDFHASMRREWLSGTELLAKLRPRYFFTHLGPAMRKLALLRSMSGAQHYEHAGRIEGEVRIDGQAYEVRGSGQRDHSWGVRDMRVPTNWRWFSGQFGDELCFNAIKVEVLGLRASGGYVYHDGMVEALTEWTYTAEGLALREGPKRVALDLACGSGKRFALTGTALSNIPVIALTGGRGAIVNETHTRFVYCDKVGRGVSEFMEQLP